MLIRSRDNGFIHPVSSEITSRSAYEGRRDMLKLMAGGVAGATLAAWAGREALAQTAPPGKLAALQAYFSSAAPQDAAWLHMRLVKGLRGTVAAWWALGGLAVTTFAFLGVNMFLSGLHSYGTL